MTKGSLSLLNGSFCTPRRKDVDFDQTQRNAGPCRGGPQSSEVGSILRLPLPDSEPKRFFHRFTSPFSGSPPWSVFTAARCASLDGSRELEAASITSGRGASDCKDETSRAKGGSRRRHAAAWIQANLLKRKTSSLAWLHPAFPPAFLPQVLSFWIPFTQKSEHLPRLPPTPNRHSSQLPLLSSHLPGAPDAGGSRRLALEGSEAWASPVVRGL